MTDSTLKVIANPISLLVETKIRISRHRLPHKRYLYRISMIFAQLIFFLMTVNHTSKAVTSFLVQKTQTYKYCNC